MVLSLYLLFIFLCWQLGNLSLESFIVYFTNLPIEGKVVLADNGRLLLTFMLVHIVGHARIAVIELSKELHNLENRILKLRPR